MKTTRLFYILILFSLMISCSNESKKATKTTCMEDIKVQSFAELFQKIVPEDFNENVFTLLNNAAVLTSGGADNFNSMTIGWGG